MTFHLLEMVHFVRILWLSVLGFGISLGLYPYGRHLQVLYFEACYLRATCEVFDAVFCLVAIRFSRQATGAALLKP